MWCARLAGNAGPKKIAIWTPSHNFVRLGPISSQLRHVSTIGKKLVKQQYLPHMFSQYCELRSSSGWDRFVSLGHPYEFQRVSRLYSVTARYSSSGRQPNFTALNRGRHLYSAGRPSRWALAHILVGRPFVKRFALCYQSVVCLSCPVLSVCDVGVLRPNGWTDQDETWRAGRPRPIRLCVRWGPSPLPKFSAHVYYSYCDFVRTLHNAQSLLVCSSPRSSFRILCILFLQSLIVFSLFRCAQLHHIATIAEVGVAN